MPIMTLSPASNGFHRDQPLYPAQASEVNPEGKPLPMAPGANHDGSLSGTDSEVLPTDSLTPACASALLSSLRAEFDSGVTRCLSWRMAQLQGLRRMMEERRGEVEAAAAEDMGRCAAESVGEVLMVWAEADMAIRNLHRWTRKQRQPGSPIFPLGSFSCEKQPLGVALIIAPWNLPFGLCLAPLASALAAGNAVVVKPSELAPASSAAIARLLPLYCDPKAVRVVQGGADTAQTLLKLKWDKIFYTGSARIGRQIALSAAQHLTPVTLELGGKNPIYIDSSANLQVAANRILFSKMSNAGQVCLAPDYLMVHEDLIDELEAVFRRTLLRFYGSNPQQSHPFARIISTRHCERLAGLLEHPSTNECIVHGGQVDIKDRYVAPTLLRNVPWDAPVMQQEVFGPILALQPVTSLDQAIEAVRQQGAPLAIYVYSEDREVMEAFRARTQSGALVSGESVIFVMNHHLPFGGVGASGYGKSHGHFGFESFSHDRALMSNSMAVDPTFRYPPYSNKAIEVFYALAKWRIWALIWALLFAK